MQIGIQEELLQLHALGLLDPLLADKTTGSHLIWATDAHADRGPSYRRDWEIEAADITGINADVIKTRARKALEQQSARTKQHAEVFTPRHICERMLSEADASYFGALDPFLSRDKIPFTDAKAWQSYVDARRLEITCGEAPYLTERYDVTSGEAIPLSERLGILDRKFRVVGENTDGEEEWLNWAFRALEATYGYEFQGDNVLLARLNLLMSFAEAYGRRFGKKPDIKSYRHAETIIVWNLWQMDGLSGTIPYCKATEEYRQFSLFDTEEESVASEQPHCRIRDWRRDRSFTYSSLKEGGSNKMKFDFVIGNPPYQEEQEGDNKTFAPPIYNKFMDAAYEVAERVELIHPARFLFDAGSTPKAWNEKMLNDVHFKVLYYEPDSSAIFPTTDIKGGVVISYRDSEKDFGAIRVFTKYEELRSMLHKIREVKPLSDIVFSRTAYRLTETLHTDFPNAVNQLSKGHAYDMSTNIFERVPQVFFDEKPNNGKEYIQILGREGNDRVLKYIRRDYVNQVENLDKYKVILPKANGTGTLGEVLSTPIIGKPAIGHTETFISIGCFNADNLLKYIKGKFCRTMLGTLKITQDNTRQAWRMVPLQDFTPSSDIDWSKPIPEIDRQLYAKYGLSESEIEFIESHVKEMV